MELILTPLKNSHLLKVCYCDKSALGKHTKQLKVDPTSKMPIYEGFRYFSPVDISSLDKHTQFICGLFGESLVGILKFYRCTTDKQELIGEQHNAESSNYLDVRYVDVQRQWQNIGVATALIKGFAMWLPRIETVALSPLTADGKRANLHEKFREHLNRATAAPYLSASKRLNLNKED